ncbi:MAG: hypothetical protein QXL94_06660, partial [Candidatus Parvarchaeum sp.]
MRLEHKILVSVLLLVVLVNMSNATFVTMPNFYKYQNFTFGLNSTFSFNGINTITNTHVDFVALPAPSGPYAVQGYYANGTLAANLTNLTCNICVPNKILVPIFSLNPSGSNLANITTLTLFSDNITKISPSPQIESGYPDLIGRINVAAGTLYYDLAYFAITNTSYICNGGINYTKIVYCNSEASANFNISVVYANSNGADTSAYAHIVLLTDLPSLLNLKGFYNSAPSFNISYEVGTIQFLWAGFHYYESTALAKYFYTPTLQ